MLFICRKLELVLLRSLETLCMGACVLPTSSFFPGRSKNPHRQPWGCPSTVGSSSKSGNTYFPVAITEGFVRETLRCFEGEMVQDSIFFGLILGSWRTTFTIILGLIEIRRGNSRWDGVEKLAERLYGRCYRLLSFEVAGGQFKEHEGICSGLIILILRGPAGRLTCDWGLNCCADG